MTEYIEPKNSAQTPLQLRLGYDGRIRSRESLTNHFKTTHLSARARRHRVEECARKLAPVRLASRGVASRSVASYGDVSLKKVLSRTGYSEGCPGENEFF